MENGVGMLEARFHIGPNVFEVIDRSTPKIHIQNWNGTLEVRFHIGQNVFVTVGRFNGKVQMSVREFYRPRPEQKDEWRACKRGLVLTPEQWWALRRSIPSMEEALLHCTLAAWPWNVGTFKPHRWDLGNQRYAIVEMFRGRPAVTLRGEFFRPSPDADPDKKGIILTTWARQWQNLQDMEDKIEIVLQVFLEDKLFLTKDLLTKLSSE